MPRLSPAEHRRGGIRTGSVGVKVDSDGETKSLTAYSGITESRIHASPSGITLETFDSGYRPSDAMASTRASVHKEDEGRISTTGYTTERTPSGSYGHPASHQEVLDNAANTLANVRNEVAAAENRQRADKAQAA